MGEIMGVIGAVADRFVNGVSEVKEDLKDAVNELIEETPPETTPPIEEPGSNADLSSGGYRAGHDRAIAAEPRNDGREERDPAEETVRVAGEDSETEDTDDHSEAEEAEARSDLLDTPFEVITVHDGKLVHISMSFAKVEALNLAEEIFRCQLAEGLNNADEYLAYMAETYLPAPKADTEEIVQARKQQPVDSSSEGDSKQISDSASAAETAVEKTDLSEPAKEQHATSSSEGDSKQISDSASMPREASLPRENEPPVKTGGRVGSQSGTFVAGDRSETEDSSRLPHPAVCYIDDDGMMYDRESWKLHGKPAWDHEVHWKRDDICEFSDEEVPADIARRFRRGEVFDTKQDDKYYDLVSEVLRNW